MDAHELLVLIATFISFLTLVLGAAGLIGYLNTGPDSSIVFLLGLFSLLGYVGYMMGKGWGIWLGSLSLLASSYYMAWPSKEFLAGAVFLSSSHVYISMLMGFLSLLTVGTIERPPEISFEAEEAPEVRTKIEKEKIIYTLDARKFRIDVAEEERVFGRNDFSEYLPKKSLARISTRHFEIRKKGDKFVLRDLHSTYGISVDGYDLLPGEEVELKYGSEINVAGVLRIIFIPEKS
ncbi:MAG: FHA domain-containing protein [Candidatus Methanodesulfokora sp.]|jgi:hypothetical protein